MACGLRVLQANSPPLLAVAAVCCCVLVQFGVEVATLPPAQDAVKYSVRMLTRATRASAVCNLFQRKHREGRRIRSMLSDGKKKKKKQAGKLQKA